MIGSLDVTLRPIKIAFLIAYGDKDALRRAIRINSFLWGGSYNPIIPIYKRFPKSIKKDYVAIRTKPIDMTKGYLDAFDPDFVVNMTEQPTDGLELHDWQIISEASILKPAKESGVPAYGVGLFEVLSKLQNDEFKYQRNNPLKINNVSFSSRYGLFFASVFGELEPEMTQRIDKYYGKDMGIEDADASLSSYTSLLDPETLFLRRFSQLYLEAYRPHSLSSGCLFYMDATSWQDIVDYLNLRAIGWKVIPIPKQGATEDSTKAFALKFIEDNFQKHPYNKDIDLNITVLKSRSLNDEEVSSFVNSLQIPRPTTGRAKVSIQSWYPRIWDSWARVRDSVECCSIEAGKERHDVSASEIVVKALAPDFAQLRFSTGSSRYANDISFRVYGSDEYYAKVLPSSIKNPSSVLGTYGFREWRFSRKGAVFTSGHEDWSVRLTIPPAYKAYEAWQRAQGNEIELSTPGRVARQIVKNLNGPDRLNVIASEGLLLLIQELTTGPGAPRPITHAKLMGRLQRIANSEGIQDPEGYLTAMIRSRIFELGAQVQCTNCSKHVWYKLEDFKKDLICPSCLDPFTIAGEDPNKAIAWAYSLLGPFRIPKMADGAYSTLLSLRFFDQTLDVPITPYYSFTAKDQAYEADFGILLKQRDEGESEIVPIFGECKSFNIQLQQEDISKMFKLGAKFRGSVLVFASLKKELGRTEKRLLLQRLESMRKQRIKNRPYSQILILTGNELFADYSLTQAWEKLGGEHKLLSKNLWDHSIDKLCDATQQLYLGAEPWHEWADAKFKEKANG